MPGLRTPRADAGSEMLVDTVGHKKLCVLWPAVAALREPDLLVSKGLAVSRSRVLLVRGAVANVTVQNDEGGAFLGLAENIEGMLDALDVVGVAHAQNVPPVRQESRLNVFCKSDARAPLDGDAVVVVDPAKIVEPQVGCQ